jgi:hypothetical protein
MNSEDPVPDFFRSGAPCAARPEAQGARPESKSACFITNSLLRYDEYIIFVHILLLTETHSSYFTIVSHILHEFTCMLKNGTGKFVDPGVPAT